MNQKIVYSKTGKGVLEIKNKAGKLSRDLTKVLALVDGKSAVVDLVTKSKMSEADIAKHIAKLEEGGYIKEFSSLSGVRSSSSPSSGASAYVDDLDFTSQLAPGKRVYSSSQVEMRARESADRQQAEADAQLKRQQDEQRKKNEAAKQAREEAVRLARIEAERKAKEAAAIKARQEAELRAKQQAAEMEKTTRDLAKILEAERQALEKADQRKKAEQALKNKEVAKRDAQADLERKRKEEEERKRREEEERKRKEEEERKRREEEERKRKEEEERKRREEEERKRREEEERKRQEEEARKRREEEDRRREEEDKRREEEDRRRAEEERQRREDEEKRREQDERRREEEEARRREDDERRRREEDETRYGEEETRYREEEEPVAETEAADEPVPSLNFDIGNFDLPAQSRSDAVKESETRSTGSFDLDKPAESEPSDDFAANFDQQQERLREQEEEKERQRQRAEAERESEERAQREAQAREEAERRAAMEAEMRARVEQEKIERAERERAKEEEYKNKIEQDEERKRADAERKQREEQQRIETERKQREEDLVRRRQQSEEADRKRAELKALQKRGKIRSPLERARPFIIGVVVVVGLVFGGINLMPMSGYIPAIEKMMSDKIGEPVTIGSMKMSLTTGLQFNLGNVNVGSTQDVTLTDVVVTPELGSLFGDKLVLRSIRADGGSMVKEVLVRLPDWLDTSMADQRLDVRAISLRGIKLDVRTFSLPTMNADVNFARDGSVSSALVASADGKLSVDVNTFNGETAVAITASNWTPPVGAPVQVAEFSAKGTLAGTTLTLNQWNATAYGGELNGTAQLSWSPRWRLTSQFEFVRIETEEMLAAFSDTAKVTGLSSGKGRFVAEAGNVDTLLDRPSLSADFVVKKGTLDGVDLVRALQSGPSGTQGGSTRFEEINGKVTLDNGQFSYRNIALGAGILTAESDFNIGGNQEVSGRVSVDLRSTAQTLSSRLNISGTLKGILLRP